MGNTPTAMIVVNTGIDAVVTHGLAGGVGTGHGYAYPLRQQDSVGPVGRVSAALAETASPAHARGGTRIQRELDLPPWIERAPAAAQGPS